jgi:hypothetical protein
VFLWFNSTGARMCLAAMGPRPWISQVRIARGTCIAVRGSPRILSFLLTARLALVCPPICWRGACVLFFSCDG